MYGTKIRKEDSWR